MPIRKIDTNKIIRRVFFENIPRFQVADEEGCSRAYITKVCNKYEVVQREANRSERLKELLPNKSDKERKWVEAVSSGMSKTNAALAVYDVKDRASAKTIGQRLGADPDLQISIQNLLHEEGIGRRYRVQKLKQVIDSPDLGLTIRGIETAARMCGEFQSDKIDVTLNQYNAKVITGSIQELREMLAAQEAEEEKNIIEITE
jgi:hypothetical protein